MKITRLTAFFAIALSILAASADVQRRRPAPRPTPKPTPVRNTVNPVVSTAKQQVANQPGMEEVAGVGDAIKQEAVGAGHWNHV